MIIRYSRLSASLYEIRAINTVNKHLNKLINMLVSEQVG